MRELLFETAPRLRRYAHALLGSWPAAPHQGARRLRADQDADDLVHQALLGFWRAGLGPAIGTRRAAQAAGFVPSPARICPDDGLKIALYRRVTALARQIPVRQSSSDIAAENNPFPPARPDAPATTSPAHRPWAPEMRALPRLSFELRALIALVTMERLSYDQAAAALDMPTHRVLLRLAVARAQLAGEIAGQWRPHLVLAEMNSARVTEDAGDAVTEGDLHRYVDDLLDRSRCDDIRSFLERHPDAARRVSEWRRNGERLRGAFAPLMREPLPLTLNFLAPAPMLLAKSRGVKGRKGLFSGLSALLAASAGRQAPFPRGN